jgi:virulence factor Mce-like protein
VSTRDRTDEPHDAFERGNRLAKEGDLEAAYDAYREADEAGHPTAAAYRGALAEARGEWDEAQDAYARADERGDGLGAFRLGLLLSRQDDWDGARAAWKRADERGREEPPFDLDRLLHGRSGDPDAIPLVRARSRSAFTNPVLIGAATVLILLVAVFLAYNADAGLPFVPTEELKVDIANGSDLTIGNNVREGGYLVGLISNMRAVPARNGQTEAELTLSISNKYKHIPADSQVAIRPDSLLGLKYIDLVTGRSKRMLSDGATLPETQTRVPVQFDDLLKTFDPRTRVAIQQDLQGYGDALGARGSSLNDTISTLPALLQHLQPVARSLAAPGTRLVPFLDSLERFVGTVAPVANTQVDVFRQSASTFHALTQDPNALEQTIAKSPPTLDVGTASLRVQQPALADLTTLGRDLQPATASLKQALPVLNPALEVGTDTLRRAPPLDQRLEGAMHALKGLAQAPGTNLAVNALGATVSTLGPMVRYLGPFQTACDDWDYWWTYLPEHQTAQDSIGFAQRVLLMFGDSQQPDNVGTQGAVHPANGQAGGPEYLHNQMYGAAVDNSGAADCETGQRGYPLKLNYADPQRRKLALDSHTPGNQGATFTGRARVPAGETFTRNPTTGPQLPYNPNNP